MLSPLLQKAGYNFHNLNPIMKIPSAAGLFFLPEMLPEKYVPQDIEDLEPMYLREAQAQVKKKKEN
jgi:hypothetical protein